MAWYNQNNYDYNNGYNNNNYNGNYNRRTNRGFQGFQNPLNIFNGNHNYNNGYNSSYNNYGNSFGIIGSIAALIGGIFTLVFSLLGLLGTGLKHLGLFIMNRKQIIKETKENIHATMDNVSKYTHALITGNGTEEQLNVESKEIGEKITNIEKDMSGKIEDAELTANKMSVCKEVITKTTDSKDKVEQVIDKKIEDTDNTIKDTACKLVGYTSDNYNQILLDLLEKLDQHNSMYTRLENEFNTLKEEYQKLKQERQSLVETKEKIDDNLIKGNFVKEPVVFKETIEQKEPVISKENTNKVENNDTINEQYKKEDATKREILSKMKEDKFESKVSTLSIEDGLASIERDTKAIEKGYFTENGERSNSAEDGMKSFEADKQNDVVQKKKLEDIKFDDKAEQEMSAL